jgi:ribonuclease-3
VYERVIGSQESSSIRTEAVTATAMAAAGWEQLETLFGHKFQRPERLERALTHSSWLAENSPPRAEAQTTKNAGDASGNPTGLTADDNEKLEFLGDAVLTLVVSEVLLNYFPTWREGQLSKARASLVNAAALAEVARRLGLGAHLRLGRGEEKTGGREKPALLADAYEAVVAAVYLDGGLDAARGFIRRSLLDAALERDSQRSGRLGEPDHKSRLQELLQAQGWPAAEYRVVTESGPDHRKMFAVEARVAGRAAAVGSGMNKKEAEQSAAQGVMAQLMAANAGDIPGASNAVRGESDGKPNG